MIGKYSLGKILHVISCVAASLVSVSHLFDLLPNDEIFFVMKGVQAQFVIQSVFWVFMVLPVVFPRSFDPEKILAASGFGWALALSCLWLGYRTAGVPQILAANCLYWTGKRMLASRGPDGKPAR